MSRQRAFVITLALDDDLSDQDIAEELADLVEEEFSVISVNPFGGDAPTLGAGGIPKSDDLSGLAGLF